MPQDTPDAVSPLAPFEGSYPIPGVELSRRWIDARDITAEQRDQVLELLRVAFNDQVSWFELPVRPQDHFDWKFRDRPVGATAHFTIDAAGRIVGFTGGIRRTWLVQGRPHISRGGYDFCRSPEWQGRGLSRALQPFSRDEWHPSEDMGVGFVTHPADRKLAIETGNTAPANETHDYVRQLRPFHDLVARLRRAWGGRARETAAPRSNTSAVIRARERRRIDAARDVGIRTLGYARALLARRPAPRRVAWSITTLERFEERHARFVEASLGQFDFVATRPLDYLNWRYCDERAGPFTVRVAEQDGTVLGYAVTRVWAGAAYLADILAASGRTDVAESLIRDAVDLARQGDASFIMTRLPMRHAYGPALARAGFSDVGHVGGELVAPRRMSPEALRFLDREDARIHLVLGDTDFV